LNYLQLDKPNMNDVPGKLGVRILRQIKMSKVPDYTSLEEAAGKCQESTVASICNGEGEHESSGKRGSESGSEDEL